MQLKLFTHFLLGFLMVEKLHGYVYGPLIDRIILYNMQYTSFIGCQINATVLRAAIKANIPVKNVPSRPIMDEDVLFLLFTRKNPTLAQILRHNDSLNKIRASNLNFANDIIIYVHGYVQTFENGASNFTKILLPKKDVNIIIVDWDSYAYFDVEYNRIYVVPGLGKIVGRFVQKLLNYGADPRKINLIGLSAGAEAVGLAGQVTNPKVARVTAFDPEGSCFNFLLPEGRVSKLSADYVQIIHCSVGVRALPPHIQGDSTFIINGGVIQPNCVAEKTIDSLGKCSHVQCETYIYESLKGNRSLVGKKCSSYAGYYLNQCDPQDRVLLTYDVPTSVRGFYFVDTVSNKKTND